MALTQLANQFRALSIVAKLGIGVSVLVVLALVSGATTGIVSHYKDRASDKQQATLKAEGDAHRQRADEAEAKAKAYESLIKDQELIIKAAGQKAEVAAAKVQDENKKFEDEMAAVGDDVDPCERVRRICKRLAIKPADCACTSN